MWDGPFAERSSGDDLFLTDLGVGGPFSAQCMGGMDLFLHNLRVG